MSATDTEAALLAAILHAPADDGPRLVYADWLEERGACERAEFVRVGCELASDLDRERACRETCQPPDFEGCPNAALRRRERALFAVHGDEWCRPLDAKRDDANLTVDEFDPADLPNYRIHARVRRGFPATVRAPLGVLLGGPCERCEGRGHAERPVDPVAFRRHGESCPACAGTGRTPGVLAALFGAAPIERVEATDREPYQAERMWWWSVAEYDERNAASLPDELLDLLQACDHVGKHPTRAAATDALSDALVRLGRDLAGLPPIGGAPPEPGRPV